MLFCIAAADGAGPHASCHQTLQYSDNLQLYSTSTPTAGGPQLHQVSIPHETDRVLRGAAIVTPDQAADIKLVRDSLKTLWEFSDGLKVWRVRKKAFDLTPLGNGCFTLSFEFMVVSLLVEA